MPRHRPSHHPAKPSSIRKAVLLIKPPLQNDRVAYRIYVSLLLADFRRAHRSVNTHQQEIAALEQAWNKAGVSLSRAFDFVAIRRVRTAVDHLNRQRTAIERTFGSPDTVQRKRFLKDWRSLRSMISRMEGLGSFKSEIGQELFQSMLGRFKQETTQAYVVKDDPRRPGEGLTPLIYARHRVKHTTMDHQIRKAITALDQAGVRPSVIASLIRQTILDLNLPTDLKTNLNAIRATVRRTLAH